MIKTELWRDYDTPVTLVSALDSLNNLHFIFVQTQEVSTL